MTTEHHSRGWSWRASGATVPVAALLIVSVILPLVVSVVAGSLELPRNDDWSYRHIALDLARTGSFSLDGISETMIIGQILFTQPFLWLSGSQPSAFVVAGVIFAVAGALSAFAMARSLLTTREAALAAASLALFPGYLAYATSYMSDVPALALQFSCLAVGMFAIRDERRRIRWLVVSGAIGIAAFSIREFSIAAPASILLAAVLVDPRRWRVWALAVAVAAICVAIHLWRGSLPGQLPAIAAGYGSFSGATQAFSSVALVLAPFALLGARAWRPHLRRLDMIVGLAIGAGLAGGRLIQWAREGTVPPVTLNNMASQFGVPARDYLVGGRPLLFDEPAWTVLNIVALVGTVVVLTIGAGIIGAVLRANGTSLRTLIRAFGSPAGSLVLFVLAMTFGLVLFGLSRPLFDRYFWPVVPPAAVLLLYVPRRVSYLEADPGTPRSSVALTAVAAAFLVVLGVTSTIYLVNSHAFDAARWSAGERLVASGVAADQVDAGYEWVGSHATTRGNPTIRTSTDTFYRSWWPSFSQCGVVSSEPMDLPGWSLTGTTTYALNLLAGPSETLYLYRVDSPGCP